MSDNLHLLGLRYVKAQPTTYLLHYRGGKIVREGQGLSFFYYAPTSSLVAIPIESTVAPFIFHEVAADFQNVTIQGEVTYRIAQPRRLASLLNYTLDAAGKNYVSDDPAKLSHRVLVAVNVLARKEIQGLDLRQTLASSEALAERIQRGIKDSPEIAALGLEILGLSIIAVRPTPETSRALEAQAREQLLQEADEAIYARRNAAVEHEREIKENELSTEIAVETKRRQIRETQMDADRAVAAKQHLLRDEEMSASIALEERNQVLVGLQSESARAQADAKAYGVEATMKALSGIDARTIQALASVGMDANRLIALAFGELAGRADKIGQLNVSPDLLRELLDSRSAS